MAEVLNQVSWDNIPEWFENILRGTKSIPSFLEKSIKGKAEELLDASKD